MAFSANRATGYGGARAFFTLLPIDSCPVFSSETDCGRLRWWLKAANSKEVLGEGVKMISRFVVVPAIPIETGSVRNGARFYCKTAPIGFILYDNEERLRLKTTYQTREEAERECLRANMTRLQGVLSERDSLPGL